MMKSVHIDKCKSCDKKSMLGHDKCFANLPGVHFACCGHGNVDDAYVTTDSKVFRGHDAFIYAAINRPGVIDVVKIYIKSAKLMIWSNYWHFIGRICGYFGYELVYYCDIYGKKSGHQITRS